MRYKIIATIVVVVIIALALLINSGRNNADSNDGSVPAATEQTQ